MILYPIKAILQRNLYSDNLIYTSVIRMTSRYPIHMLDTKKASIGKHNQKPSLVIP